MFCPLSPAPAHRAPGTHGRAHAATGAARHVNATAVARAGPCRHPCTHSDFRTKFSVNFRYQIFRRRVSVRLICKKCSESQSERDTVL